MSMKENPQTTDQPSVALDYVFAGRRRTVTGKLVAVIRKIIGDTLEKDELYDAKLLKGKVVGCIYRGATFHEGGSKNLKEAAFIGYWKDSESIIQWKALDEVVESAERQAKLESDAKKINEIEQLLLPLRKIHSGYNKRYDHAGKEALEQAVLRALRSPPRKSELE